MAKLESVRNIPRSSEREALRAAHLIVASYQQKAQNPEVYLKQVAALLTGIHSETLMRIADPKRGGIVAECRFLPSLAELRDWIDKAETPYFAEKNRLETEIETLTYKPEPEVPKEERERRAAELTEKFQPVKPKSLDWLKPESEQHPETRAESERLRRVQREGTDEERAQLLETDLLKSTDAA